MSILEEYVFERPGEIVRRYVGTPDVPSLDPFLMLDYFEVQPPASYHDHPHCGFESISYMLSGHLVHKDFIGNNQMVTTGDIMNMTAGKAIMHCESPRDKVIGINLWLNLSIKDKNCSANFVAVADKNTPKYNKDGISISVLMGEVDGVRGNLTSYQPCHFLDVRLVPGAKFVHKIPEGWNCFALVMEGPLTVDGDLELEVFEAVKYEKNKAEVVNTGAQDGRILVFAGEPIKEPTYRPLTGYGFVVNHPDEVDPIAEDFKAARNGFERALGWKS